MVDIYDVAALKDWLLEHNPALFEEIADKVIYDGVIVICQHYGIQSPKETDTIKDSQRLILIELEKHI